MLTFHQQQLDFRIAFRNLNFQRHCVMLDILETTRVASDALQSRGIALDKVLQLIDDATSAITEKRTDEYFELLMTKAVDLARDADISTDFVTTRVRRRTVLPGEADNDESVSMSATVRF